MFSQVSVCPQGGVADTPWADTSQADPPPADTPWADHTPPPLGQTPHHWTDTPPVQCILGYGQQSGGTHPIGMHSC